MKLKDVLLVSLGLTVMWLLASCQSGNRPTVATSLLEPVTSTVVTQSSLVITPSPLPISTATVNFEMTSSSVLDLTPSSTTTLKTATPLLTLAVPTIAAVTLTPLPTFTSDELEVAVAELLANPMNCDVPCWWGAMPNETTVFEVQQFLTLYQFTDYKPDGNQIPDYIDIGISFDENENIHDFRVRYYFENNLLKIVHSEQSPPLHDILEIYGQPDEVWLETMSFEREESLPLRLNMVYLQEGIAVGYVVDGDIQNDMVIGCFADEETGLLQLNIPGSSINYRDFRGIFEIDRRYLPLEEATGLTMEDFIQRFTDPTQPHCIETPAELWE